VSHAPIHPGTTIGHVHLKVSNLDRALTFYTGVMGFTLMQRYGAQAAFVSAGGYHHHIGLNTWHSLNAPPAPERAAGLYHFAILLPNRKELARTLQRLIDHDWPIDGASDHGVSEAIYFRDPDQNGIEIYADRPREQWKFAANGELQMVTQALDFEGLMAELK
jgi:catechol 2,3-dioxygenase